MPTTAAHDKVNKPLEFTATEYCGNEVICTAQTWNSHVCAVDGHPAMVGLQAEVKAALSDPSVVYPSTISDRALIYEATTQTGMDIRVVVTYDDISRFETGETIGKMNTAFPVDAVIYDKPNIGPPIYTKMETDPSRPEGGTS